MNQKKAKALRKLVRASGQDPRAAEYQRGAVHSRPYFTHEGPRSFTVTGTITLVERCGRAVYRGLKSVSAAAFEPLPF